MKISPHRAASAGKASTAVLIVVQFLGVLALGVWVVMLKHDLGMAEVEIASLRRAPSPDETLKQETRTLRNQVAALESQIAIAKAAAAATPPPPPAPAPAVTPASALAALVNNPAMRSTVGNVQKRMLETRYADLFTLFQFSPEQRTRFIDMINDLQAPMLDASLKVVGGTTTPAERAALEQQAKDVDATIDTKVREFLGDDNKYATYKQFMEQQGERTQVNQLKATLAQANLPALTAEQSATLTDIMYVERKSIPMTPTATDPNNPLVPSTEGIANRVREQTNLNERIANRAASVLSPEQLDSLRKQQAARVESLKLSGDMVRQMLGTPAAPAAK